MLQRENYAEMPTSKLYRLAERILEENIREVEGIMAQLEGIRKRFTQKSINDYKPRLRVVWPED